MGTSRGASTGWPIEGEVVVEWVRQEGKHARMHHRRLTNVLTFAYQPEVYDAYT